MLLTELFDSKVAFKVTSDTDTEYATFTKLTDMMGFRAEKLGSTGNYWACDFGKMRPNGSLMFGLTNNQDAVKVLAFVTLSMGKFLKKHKPTKLKFEAHGKRASLYRRMLTKLLPGYDVQELKYDESSKFILSKKQIAEVNAFPAEADTFYKALDAFINEHGGEAFHGLQAAVIVRGKFAWRTWFKDEGYDRFLEYLKTHKSEFFPKIYGDVREAPTKFKMQDTPLKYLRIEKLQSLEPNTFSDAVDTLGLAIRKTWPDTVEELAELALTLKVPSFSDAEPEDIKNEILSNQDFFKEVLGLLKAGADDINSENVMRRGDVPVITDPFSS